MAHDLSSPSRSPVGATELDIRPLRADELPAADAVRRLAFGTFLGLPDPMQFRGDADPVRPRFLADPAGSFVADVDGELVGSNVIVDWGSVGFFGPLSIRPDFWDRGLAQRLVEVVLDEFARRGTRHVGLFTFGNSPKHHALYQKFGFWPRFPIAIMARPVRSPDVRVGWIAYSDVEPARQQAFLQACGDLCDAVYPGLDLGREIQVVAEHGLGETVVLVEGDELDGFAVCHAGPETEAGSRRCYIKFGAVRPGPKAGDTFDRLLLACESLAASRDLHHLVAGVNTARREAYRRLLASGFRSEVIGLAMDRPDEAAYNRAEVYVIDDWR